MLHKKGFVHYFRKEIYQPKVAMEEPCFIYIRAFNKAEVKFSVLDYMTEYPDFSRCGVFTVSRDDFFKLMTPLES